MPAFLRTLGHRLYTTWATFWFVLPFVVTYPLQLILVRRPAWRRHLHSINRNWAKLSILMWGVPLDIVRESTKPVPQPCIYVANHGSYIDILVLFYTIPGFLNMMGKDALVKFPLWGPIFGKTYIPVNRRSVVSRGRAFALAKQGLLEGRPLALFPEGTIGPKPGEELQPFQDGAFQMAISLGVPLVPVSMPLNHKFMPSVAGLRVRHAPLRIVFHEAIDTTGLTQADVPALKAKVMAQIADDFVPEGKGIPEASRFFGNG